MIGSDFGRAPEYKDGGGTGKSPYPLGCYVVLTPTTDDAYYAGSGTVHGATTFEQEQDWNNTVTTEQAHVEFGRLLSIDQGLAAEFPL